MFIRSSTAINDCLIALNTIQSFVKYHEEHISIGFKSLPEVPSFKWSYESQEARDKAYDELCAFLNSNYKLRDFT